MLYRQDLKDLFELTVGKMDSYMIVNVLMLGITAEMYFKGRAPLDVPGWLFWYWGVSLSGSFFFILFSIWLALHASVLAQTYMARCLTQWLRLPIPSMEEINAASARLEEYENNSFLDFVRPPVVVPMGEQMGNNQANRRRDHKDLSSHWTEFSEHFTLFNSLHTKWQSHEAYARVSMCFGTNQLLSAFSYFALTYWSVDYENPWIGAVFVALATLAQLIHIRMSLNLTEREHYLGVALVVLPPVCVTVAAALCSNVDEVTGTVHVPTSAVIVACIGYVIQFGWVLFFLFQTYHDADGLPMKFSTVWCLEILGFGIETMRDIEEPRVDFPGFIQPSTDPSDRPLNTYNVTSPDDTKKNPDGETVLPLDILNSCKSLEAKLQRLFAYWARNSHELTLEELSHIEELKAAFDEDTELLQKSLDTQETSQRKSEGGIASESLPEREQAWVRLAYESDEGTHAPYLLNPETGEIKWEANANDTLLMEINRGLSLLPEQLEKYHENVQKIEYANRRDYALKRQKNIKPPKWPWEFFRTGGVLILISWLSALIETILDQAGVGPHFSPTSR